MGCLDLSERWHSPKCRVNVRWFFCHEEGRAWLSEGRQKRKGRGNGGEERREGMGREGDLRRK